MSNSIVCGKLDNRSNFGPPSKKDRVKVRLRAKRVINGQEAATLSISASKSSVWFEGVLWDSKAFLTMVAAKGVNRLCVLTSREYITIVELASAHGIAIEVFEESFPIFSEIKFNSSLRANYDILTSLRRKVSQLDIHSKSLSKYLSARHLTAVIKKLSVKNGYDRHFFFAFKEGYQEVFKLKEERKNRVIIALDFNSMYLECMKGRFCNPSSIQYQDFHDLPVDPKELASGIYRVRLRGAQQSFLLEHHPFLYKRFGRSFYFGMSCGDSIETVLHRDEIDYYISFFDSVEIIEGLFSEVTIEHPLLSQGLSLYSQRMHHRRRGDRVKENLCKASIQHMHSATNQKRFASKLFASIEEIQDFLSKEFAMNLDGISHDEVADFLISHKYFKLTRTSRGFRLSYLDAAASDTLFSLSSQVAATARLKMLKTLERLMNYQSVELCYANVDSIHLSIPRHEVDSFLQQNQDLISDELGALKVEAIADQGYWFDVGRYWLKKDGDVALFKNKGFNHKAALHPFVSRCRVSSFIETPEFSHLKTRVMKIENSFTYHKRLLKQTGQESRFARFRYEEIRDLHTANFTEAEELLSSMKVKIELFQKISNETPNDIEGK